MKIMRKVFISESQLDFLINENDYGAYLSDKGIENAVNPFDISNAEISVSDTDDDDIEYPDVVTTDKSGKEKHRNGNPYFGTSYYKSPVLEDNKKKLYEGGNSQLKNKSIKLPSWMMSNLDNSKQSNEIKKDPNISFERAKMIVSRNGDTAVGQYLKKQTKASENNIKSMKQTKKDNGEENAFLKTHNKTSGNGKAHTQKNEYSITYFD